MITVYDRKVKMLELSNWWNDNFDQTWTVKDNFEQRDNMYLELQSRVWKFNKLEKAPDVEYIDDTDIYHLAEDIKNKEISKETPETNTISTEDFLNDNIL